MNVHVNQTGGSYQTASVKRLYGRACFTGKSLTAICQILSHIHDFSIFNDQIQHCICAGFRVNDPAVLNKKHNSILLVRL